MVQIPPSVQIKSAIKPGSVYYFPEASFSSSEPHYFVVLNHNPLTDTFLVLVCASSQIEKVKRRRQRTCPANTLVELSPSEYSAFTKPCIIDCNTVHEHTIENLVSMRGKYDLKTKPEMAAAIVETLRQAVVASPLVTGKIKSMLQE